MKYLQKVLQGAICSILNEEQTMFLAKMFEMFLDDLKEKSPIVLKHFLQDPAAKAHHQNYEGGLLEHSFKFAAWLYGRILTFKSGLTVKEVIRIAVFHDFCKLGLYKKQPDGHYTYDKEKYKHHALESIKRAEFLGYELSQAERVCILLHMAGGWWNAEDEAALTENDKVFIANNFKLISASQWADMRACE